MVWRKEASDVKGIIEDGTLNESQSKVLLFISENEGVLVREGGRKFGTWIIKQPL